MNETDKQAISNAPPPQKAPLPVKFVTQKGGQYRTFHADGVWAVSCGADNVLLDFFVEHGPLPAAIVQPVTPDGQFTGEQELHGVVDPKYFIMNRDYQVGVVLTPFAIMQLHQVLGNIITNLSQAKALVEPAVIKKDVNK